MTDPYLHRFRPPTGDNYQYLMVAGDECLAVDPFDENKVFAELEALTLTPKGIVITHTHWDHINGVKGFLQRYPVPVYVHPMGEKDVTGELVAVDTESQIPLGDTMATVFHAPGHHPAHIIVDWENHLIVGDVLFLAGCGNPNFGGNVDLLFETVWSLVRKFDPELKMAWGHDYADKNMAFAKEVDSNNPAIDRLLDSIDLARNSKEDLAWRTLADELEINPFLRCDQERVAQSVGQSAASPRDVFLALRQKRNTY